MHFSVIMPVYNCDQYLEWTIKSILMQTHQDWDLTCVDDGSTDSSLEILKRYEDADSRIHVFHIENCGVSSARNYGLEKAGGEIISFIDADDYISKNLYENVDLVFNKCKCDVCIVGIEKVHSFAKPDNQKYVCPVKMDFFNLVDKMNSCKSNVIGGVVNKFYRRDKIINKKFDVDVHINEDMLFNCKVMRNNEDILYLQEPYYKYYVANADSASKNVFYSEKGYMRLQSGIEAYNRMIEICDNKKPLYANQGIMYMNLLFIMKNLSIIDNELMKEYKEKIRERLNHVLCYDGIDFKHKIVFCIACANYHLASFIKDAGKRIMA